jgi:hypothetical protein
MAALTHAQCMTAFQHITENVMLKEDTDSLMKALANAGVNDIFTLIGLSKQKIKALKYDKNGILTVLDPGSQNEVTTFVAYVCHRIHIGTPIGTNYLSITQEEFDNYRCGDYMALLMADASGNPEMNDPSVADFLEGTCRDSRLFPNPIVCDDKADEQINIAQEESVVGDGNKKDDFIKAMDPVSVFNGRHRIRHHADFFPVLEGIKLIRHMSNLSSVLNDITSHIVLLKALLRKFDGDKSLDTGEGCDDTAALTVLAEEEETEIVFGNDGNNPTTDAGGDMWPSIWQQADDEEGKAPGRAEDVPRELEQPDLKEKSAFVLEEYDKDLARSYEEYKTKVLVREEATGATMMTPEMLLLISDWYLLPPSEPPPPEPPPPEPPPLERMKCRSLDPRKGRNYLRHLC